MIKNRVNCFAYSSYVCLHAYTDACRSMLPDVIDESLLTNNVRREELFYAFFMFVSKLSNGLALGVSTAVYKYVCCICNKAQ